MALQIKCKKGHSFTAADLYPDWPEGAPKCPECYEEWKRQQEEKPPDLGIHVADKMKLKDRVR